MKFLKTKIVCNFHHVNLKLVEAKVVELFKKAQYLTTVFAKLSVSLASGAKSKIEMAPILEKTFITIKTQRCLF